MAPPAARRHAAEALAPLDVPAARMAAVADLAVPGPAGPIAVRLYEPPAAGPHGIVYFHGGGGVIGSIRSSEAVVRALAAGTGCTVASVEYRLGPEHPHPAAVDDAQAAWAALAARVGAAGRVAVAGDSFGAYLAAHVERGSAAAPAPRRPDLQVLIYPLVDLTLTSASIDRFAEGYLLTKPLIHWFRGNYLRPEDDPRAISPLYWERPTAAAPALIATAGFDPLVDEGDAYAARLAAAGTPVRHLRHASLVHGYLSLAGAVTGARAALRELCAELRALLAGA
jgi:acetyl esterase